MIQQMRKYPRTRHVEGSRLQEGDEDLSQVPFASLIGKHLVVEEKVDGANMGVFFGPDATMYLQSRGHILTGGSAFESQFDIAKAWAQTYRGVLWEVLRDRYVMYGECMYKKHTVFYDALPHYFLEFDVYDREADVFLSTEMRRILFDSTPVISVPVLHEGPLSSLDELKSMLRPSLYKTEQWLQTYERVVQEQGLDLERALALVEHSDMAEGLYLKWEEDGQIVRWEEEGQTQAAKDAPQAGVIVEGRYKWVRADFHQQILEANAQAGGHVAFQPTIPNQLAPDVNIFGWAG